MNGFPWGGVFKRKRKGEGRRSKDISCRLKDISQVAFPAVFCEGKDKEESKKMIGPIALGKNSDGNLYLILMW